MSRPSRMTPENAAAGLGTKSPNDHIHAFDEIAGDVAAGICAVAADLAEHPLTASADALVEDLYSYPSSGVYSATEAVNLNLVLGSGTYGVANDNGRILFEQSGLYVVRGTLQVVATETSRSPGGNWTGYSPTTPVTAAAVLSGAISKSCSASCNPGESASASCSFGSDTPALFTRGSSLNFLATLTAETMKKSGHSIMVMHGAMSAQATVSITRII